MTLIAKTTHRGMPTLIADILFTSEENNDGIPNPIDIGDLPERTENFKVKHQTFKQKIYIVKPNLCIGLSGIECEMRNFLREFRLQCSYYNEINSKVFVDIYNRIDKEGLLQQSSIMLCLATDNRQGGKLFQTVPYEHYKLGHSMTFEKIHAIGSGAISFIEFSQRNEVPTAATDADAAMHANLVHCSNLMAYDVATTGNLQEAWGSGFEIVYYDGDSFQKLDDFAMVTMSATVGHDGKLTDIVFKKIFHSKYCGERLVYSSLDIQYPVYTEDGDYITYESDNIFNQVFILATLEPELSQPINIKDYSFETELFACSYLVFVPEKGFFVKGFFLYRSGGYVKYRYEEGKSSVEVKLPFQLIDIIEKSL